MKFKKFYDQNERGVILITTLLFVLIIGMLATSLFAITISERRQVDFEINRITAFHLAEGGIDEAMVNLETNTNYPGTDGVISFGNGSYSTAVTQPNPLTNPNVRRIISTGYSPASQNTAYGYQERMLTTFVTVDPKPLYNNAVFAQNQIVLSGNSVTDSYNSANGSYGSLNMGNKGNVASNTITTGDMDLSGRTLVKGDAVAGPLGNASDIITLSGSASVTGDIRSATRAQSYDSPAVPEGLPSSGSLVLGADDVMALAAGTYQYNKISISGDAKLTLLGPVTVYSTGDVSIKGNSVVSIGNIPSNFMLYVVGDQEVTISGTGAFYGVIHAPESGKRSQGTRAIGVRTTGNTEIFGAVVCYKFEGRHASLHYDEGLSSIVSSKEFNVGVVSWQEA